MKATKPYARKQVATEHMDFMVGVAQLARAPDCGSGGREVKFRHLPHFIQEIYMKIYEEVELEARDLTCDICKKLISIEEYVENDGVCNDCYFKGIFNLSTYD